MKRRTLEFGILVAALAFLPGCMSCWSPVPPTSPHVRQLVELAPQPCRNHVHIFMVNGVDPLECGNFAGLRDHLNRTGFPKTYYGLPYHAHWMRDEIIALRRDQPHERVVLIGYDWGAASAVKIVRELHDVQVAVDLLVLLSPCGVEPDATIPAGRILNLRGEDWFFTAPIVANASNVTVADAGHHSICTNRLSVDLISKECNTLALTVPIITPVFDAPPPLVDAAPSPRPITAVKARRDGWDFLKARYTPNESAMVDAQNAVRDPAELPPPTPAK